MSNNSSLHRYAFDKMAQASLIATVADNKIITANKAATTLLGYSTKDLLKKSWLSLFRPKEASFKKMLLHRKATGEGSGLVCVILKNNKVICCEVTSALFMDEEGIERSITTLEDRSSSIRLQKTIDTRNRKRVANNINIVQIKQRIIDTKKDKEVADNITIAKTKQRRIDTKNERRVANNIVLAQSKSDQRFQLIFNSSSDVLYEIDLVENTILLSDAYEKEFGYPIKANMSVVADWADHIHPDDKDVVIKNYTAMLRTRKTEWKFSYRFLKADQSVATVLSSAIMLRTIDGKAYRMIGSMQDISKQTVLEAKLKSEIQLKQRQIAAAMQEAKETERSDIGKELHDNVNQLLGVSRLYLDVAKKGGPDSAKCLSRSSEYTLTAIEEIRKLTKGLTTDTIHHLGLREAIETISRDSMQVSELDISCKMNGFDEKSVNEKFKVNLFRIVQEQLNNILKHAHATHVVINLSQNKGATTLTLTDDGVGFDTSGRPKGIGLVNIRDRANLFGGHAEFESSLGKGCRLKVEFPKSSITV